MALPGMMAVIVEIDYSTLTRSTLSRPTLDIDALPLYSTRQLYFGSTIIQNGPQDAGIWHVSPFLAEMTLTLTYATS